MNPFAGGRRMKPTKNHRPAVWENMLGTVYAMNDDRVVKYFDYDYAAAREYAGVCDDRDPRLAKGDARGRYTWTKNGIEPRYSQPVLWITKR